MTQRVLCRWQFKAKNFDSVLLFKMGKFYEMFEMDAHTGAEVLGLTYMKVASICLESKCPHNSHLSLTLESIHFLPRPWPETLFLFGQSLISDPSVKLSNFIRFDLTLYLALDMKTAAPITDG